MITEAVESITVTQPIEESHQSILTPDAIKFLKALHLKFNDKRKILLQKRVERQQRINRGELPNFLDETKHLRESNWKASPIPSDIQDRRVEITGPVDRKMIINALNSGAKVFMADFEDSNAPSWLNVIEGQINLKAAVDRTIEFKSPETGKAYQLNENIAVLFVRPRGWHLEERHFLIDGEPISASLFDFGLYFYHNANTLIQRGSAPYFYLPKLESYLEARLWNEVFEFAQRTQEIPTGTIKATVLIETILASFELDEILYELKEHSAGLNCGRWDYIFSYIKKLNQLSGYVLPERSQVTMESPFMEAYSKLVVDTCHKRGVHAMGGMSAFIPIKGNEAENSLAIEKVINDKTREVTNGHDGSWVAHPGLVEVVKQVFDKHMPEANQIHKRLPELKITSEVLLLAPKGNITEAGLRNNIAVGLRYLESWLRGSGAVAIYNLMEDAATAEISRTQVWQWIKNKSILTDGSVINVGLYEKIRDEELDKIKLALGADEYQKSKYHQATTLFDDLVKSEKLEDFLTIPAYAFLP